MSLLSLAQRAAMKIGLVPVPTTFVGSQDATAILLLECANEEGAELAREWEWQALRAERTFTATNTAAQAGALPADFDRMVNESLFNRTSRRPVNGPLTAQQWQGIKSSATPMIFDSYRFQGGAIEILPIPTAGTVFAFEYLSRQWVRNAQGTARYELFRADDDTALVSEELIRLGTIWRFKQSRGLEYADDMATYERQKVRELGRDGSRKTVYLAAEPYEGPFRPMPPDGNWSW